jgi:hypothetical protein
MFSIRDGLTSVSSSIKNSFRRRNENRNRAIEPNAVQNERVDRAAQVPFAKKFLTHFSESSKNLMGRVSSFKQNRRAVPAAKVARTSDTNAVRLVRSVSKQASEAIENVKEALNDPKNREYATLLSAGLGLVGLGYLVSAIPSVTGFVPNQMAQQGAAIVNGAVLSRIGSYVCDQLTQDTSRYKRIFRTVFYAALSSVSPYLPMGALASEAVFNVRQLRAAETNLDANFEMSSDSDVDEADEIVEVDGSDGSDEDFELSSDEEDEVIARPARPARNISVVNHNASLQAGKSILGALGYGLMSHINPLAARSGVAAQAAATAGYIHSSSTLAVRPEVTGALLLGTALVALHTPEYLIGTVAAGALLNSVEWLTQRA